MMTARDALREVAADLGVNPKHLAALIEFESGGNPKAKNPRSSARGLLQFIDSTARGLGYKNSADLVAKHPTAESQIRVPVKNYLKKFAPFPTQQSLYLAVFYPAARYWEPSRQFPEKVKKANPGINTPADYVKYVQRKVTGTAALGGLGLAVLAAAAYIILKKGKLWK